jgi:DNA mismatch repair protein MutS2
VTLEAGGMRVTVPVEDLEPSPTGSLGGAGGRGGGREDDERSTIGTIGLERARSVASSLDLRGARVDEALEALRRYIDDAALAGLEKVLIIHGLGTGALRDAVRQEAASHPLVTAVRPGERGEGGDGASIVSL